MHKFDYTESFDNEYRKLMMKNLYLFQASVFVFKEIPLFFKMYAIFILGTEAVKFSNNKRISEKVKDSV